METDPQVEEIVVALQARAQALWRGTTVRPQQEALRATAAELVLLANAALSPELEPRFF